MPTYEYLCPACGVVEALQSMRDAPLTVCPQCGVEPVTRMVSRGAGVIFKGSGFWETDYNRPASEAAAKRGKRPAADQPAAEPGTPQPAPKPAPSGGNNPA